MAYADCFAAALVKLCNAELVTGEEDFRMFNVEEKILWLHE